MVEVSYPGVYVVEKPSGVHTISGVSTSITAFLGPTLEGPIDKPVRILSFQNFEKIFGKPYPDSELSTSVRLFFQNGGSDCYVVRLIGEGTGKQASLILKNEANDMEVLKFSAKSLGTWGNEMSLEIDYNTPGPEDTFNVKLFRYALDGTIVASETFLNCNMNPYSTKFAPTIITQISKLMDCELPPETGKTPEQILEEYKTKVTTKECYSEARKIFSDGDAGITEFKALIASGNSTFMLRIDDSQPFKINLDRDYSAITTPQQMETELNRAFNESLPSAFQNKVTAHFEILTDFPNTGEKKMMLKLKLNDTRLNKMTVSPGPEKDAAVKLMLGTAQGGMELSRPSYYRHATNGIFFETTKLNNLAQLFQRHFDKIVLNKGKLDESPVEFKTDLVTTGPDKPWYEHKVDTTVVDDDGIREKISIIAKKINEELPMWACNTSGLRLTINKKLGAQDEILTIHTEDTTGTSPTPDIASFFKTNCRQYKLGIGSNINPNLIFTGISELGEDPDRPSVTDYEGDEMNHTGLYALDSVDLFNIMVIPDDHILGDEDRMNVWAPASVYCKKRRAFLIISSPKPWSTMSPNDILQSNNFGIQRLRRGVVLDHSAVYFPRIIIPEGGIKKPVDAAGAIAGIMARTDGTVGVWKAPAGLKADLQGGSFDIETVLSDKENGILNKEAVNCLRIFPSGLVCWGARTMNGADSETSEWKYVPVRRLALFIEESLYRGTKFAVFEPNDEPLWAQLRGSITTFMRRLFRAQALQGRTEDEAFFVKCDNETTTEDDRNLGIVNIQVGFAPLKPAEFIILYIQQMAGQS